MTTNKPKVVIYRFKDSPDDMRSRWCYTRLARHVPKGHHGEALIRLADYEALQAECDTLEQRFDELADSLALAAKERMKLQLECESLQAECEQLRNGLKNARYRIEQGRVWNGMGWSLTGLHAYQQQRALDEIDAAMQKASNES